MCSCFQVTPFSFYNIFLPRHAMFLELDLDGKVINSFHDPEGATVRVGVSEAFQYGDHVYLGHFSAPFLGKLHLTNMYDS